MTAPHFVPLFGYSELSTDLMQRRAAAFYRDIRRRRTVRYFSDRLVPNDIIETCIRAAATAPSGASGANMQPWHFVVVSDPTIKRQIRAGAEAEEREFYERRAPLPGPGRRLPGHRRRRARGLHASLRGGRHLFVTRFTPNAQRRLIASWKASPVQ